MTYCVDRAPRSLTLVLLLLAAGCDDSPPPATDAGPLPIDPCTNADDLAIMEALAGTPDGGVPDGGPYPTSFQEALTIEIQTCANQTCLTQLLTGNGGEECMIDCLATTGAAGLSTGCLACQNEVVQCGATHCINVCLGSDEALCRACGYEYCTPRLGECTGLPQPVP